MALDQPLTVYPEENKKHTKKEFDDAYKDWAERHRSMSLDGRAVKLSDLLSKGSAAVSENTDK